jgi:nucleoside-diphosphate-sugar epimerase
LKTILIIGGTGFFGHSILKFFSNSNSLKKEFRKIIIVSRKKLQKYDYLKQLKKNYKVTKINSDIRNLKKIPNADYVIYAAILNNFKQDYLAVKNYTNLALKYHKNSRILFTSSGAVYGKQAKKSKRIKENFLFCNRISKHKSGYKSLYSNYKLKSEKLFENLSLQGLRVSVARCFAFVGEFLPLNSHFVIGNIIQSILQKKEIKINAQYKIYRSYMYADDLVRWLIKIVKKSNKSFKVYNLGSDDEVTIQLLVYNLSQKYKLKTTIPKVKLKQVDYYVPNVDKAKKELNLKIKYSSFNSIQKTINLLHSKHTRNC